MLYFLLRILAITCQYTSQQDLHQISVPFNLIEITSHQVDTFKHLSSDGPYKERFSNLLLINNRLYLTGRNHVFCLSALRINNHGFTKKFIPPTNQEHDSESAGGNYFMFLAFREQLSDLIVCGVDIGYDLNEIDLSSRVEYSGEFMCPGLGSARNLNLISFDSQVFLDKSDQAARKGLMYSAIWVSGRPNKESGVFSQYGIFRKAIEIKKYLARSISSPYWLWQPEFISISEDEKFVYFFFTEISIELFFKEEESKALLGSSSFEALSDYTIANAQRLRRYARVARVCKNDQGVQEDSKNRHRMWTSFRKIRLKCNCGHLASFEINFEKLALTKKLSDDRVVAVFHEYLAVDASRVSSVVCEFNLTMIRLSLEARKFWSRTDRTDFDCNDGPATGAGEADEVYEFLSENTILDTSVSGECKLILPYNITALDFVREAARTVAYLATSSGKIVRVISEGSVYEVLSVLSLRKLMNANIIELLINKKEQIIYVSTEESVLQINTTSLTGKMCGYYRACSKCIRDPLCFWDVGDKTCVGVKKSDSDRVEVECSKEPGGIEVRTNSLECFKGESLVLECSRDLFEVNENLELDREKLSRRIAWFENGLELVNDKFNSRIGRDGELIILNVDRSSVYTCRLDGDLIMIANLTVIEKSKDFTESVSATSSLESLMNMFDEWKSEVQEFNQKYDQFSSFYNCSST